METRTHLVKLNSSYNLEDIDELCDKFNEVDFIYGNEHIKFRGSAERFQELMRACNANGMAIKAEKLV